MSEKLFYEFSGDGTSFLLPDVASTKRDGIVHSFAVMQYEKGGFMKLPKYLANLYFVVEVEETGRGVCYEFFSGCCIGPWKDGECRAKSNELSVNLRAGSIAGVGKHEIWLDHIARFTAAGAADHDLQKIALMMPSVQTHGEVFGKNDIVMGFCIAVFAVKSAHIAPIGGAVFLTWPLCLVAGGI